MELILATTALQLNHFKALDLCRIAAACASTQGQTPVLSLLATNCTLMIDRFMPTEICSLIWFFSKANEPHLFDDFLFAACGRLKQPLVNSLQPKDLCCTVWGLARFRFTPASGCMRDMASVIESKCDSFSVFELSNIFWAYTSLRVNAQSLFQSIIQRLVQQSDRMSPVEISNIVWAMAVSGNYSTELFSAIGSQVSSYTIASLHPRVLCKIVWGMAVCGQYDMNLFREVFARGWDAAARDVQDIQRVQIYQAYLGFTIEGKGESTALPSACLHACKKAFIDETSPSSSSGDAWDYVSDGMSEVVTPPRVLSLTGNEKQYYSIMHAHVSECLGTMGIRHSNEYMTPEGFCVDIAIMPEGIALEVSFKNTPRMRKSALSFTLPPKKKN
jgi:hypothetical protein